MLLTSKFKTGDVITIKNILGEEIICKYETEDQDNYVISEPFLMAMAQQGPMLVPVVMTAVEIKETPFKKDHAMWVVESQEDVKNMYIQKTTGIVPVAANSKIIT